MEGPAPQSGRGAATRRPAPDAGAWGFSSGQGVAAVSSNTFAGNHQFMEPVKPLSIKFDPEARKQIKKIAFLLDWPEGHFVKASVSVVLDMIEDRLKLGEGKMPRTVFLARQVLDYEKSGTKQSHPLHPRRK